MNKNRCPWCGKKINPSIDGKDVEKKKTSRYLTYAKCSSCGHYYGQSINSNLIKCVFLAAGVLLLIAFISGIYNICFLLILIPFIALCTSFKRMDENENIVKTDHTLDVELVFIEAGSIRTNEFYFLNSDFDEHESFSCVSPICIYCLKKKGKRTVGYFLYEHNENAEYINKNECDLYNSEKNLVAKVKLLKDRK